MQEQKTRKPHPGLSFLNSLLEMATVSHSTQASDELHLNISNLEDEELISNDSQELFGHLDFSEHDDNIEDTWLEQFEFS